MRSALLAAIGLLPLSAAAQESVWESYPAWELTYRHELDASLEDAGDCTVSDHYAATASGTILFERFPDELAYQPSGLVPVTVDYSGSAVCSGDPPSGMEETMVGQTSMPSGTASLSFTDEGAEISLPLEMVPVAHEWSWIGPLIFEYEPVTDWYYTQNPVGFFATAPAAGDVFSGTVEGSIGWGAVGLWTYLGTGLPFEEHSRIEFTLTPRQEVLRLVVESPDGAYEKAWRPTANTNGSAGTPLTLTARLLDSRGQPATARIKSFIWELQGTSREPGISLNFPLHGAKTPDMTFDPKDTKGVVTQEGQHRERLAPDAPVDTATILPFDSGGWSTLVVRVVLEDGKREIVGRYGDAADGEIRLPKRRADSKIADVWREEVGASGPDDEDDESDLSDGKDNGDGFTLYEEYRGFTMGGKPLGGNPQLRDYFVRNTAGAMALGGIGLFAIQSGLAVHAGLWAREWDPATEVMNGNRGAGPSLTEQQHGVDIKVEKGQFGECHVDANGPPGVSKHVHLAQDIEKHPTRDPTIAHELLHSVNVYHHGDGDPSEGVLWSLDDDGNIVELNIASGGELAIQQVLNESKVDVTERMRAALAAEGPHKLWRGVDNGEHSGDENCLMRYDVSQTYFRRGSTSVSYVIPGETTGTGICRGPAGTGVNDSGTHPPQSRYLGARRGNCFDQIRVKDAP